ncbi:unnamed protein product, partial [Chrysoparadoxa australica]
MLRKRLIYCKRDVRGFIFQIVLPTAMLFVGLLLLNLSREALVQPMMLMNPSEGFGSKKPSPVPYQSLSDSPLAEGMAKAMSNGDLGVMPIFIKQDSSPDQFNQCAQGAAPLLDMSNWLLDKDALATGADGEEHTAAKENKAWSPLSLSWLFRYGAVTLAEQTEGNHLVYNTMVNTTSFHAAPVMMNLVHSAALQGYGAKAGSKVLPSSPSSVDVAGRPPSNSQPQPLQITLRNNPLPKTVAQEAGRKELDGFTTSLIVTMAFCMIPAAYAIYVVKEREVKAKHQQMMSGVSAAAYWISSLVFDMATYSFTCIACLIMLFLFALPGLTEGDSGKATVWLLVLYGPSVIPFTYCVSWFFASHSSAQSAIVAFNFMGGLGLMVTSFIMSFLDKTRAINSTLQYIFRLFPGYSLGHGLCHLSLCKNNGSTCPVISLSQYFDSPTHPPMHWDIAGGDITYLVWTAVVYTLLAVGIEFVARYPKLMWLLDFQWRNGEHDYDLKPKHLDEDVAAEALAVLGRDSKDDAVCLKDLTKVFPSAGGPSKVAVDGLSFAIPRGQCFGFLGINGAGKTTTLSMLSGVFHPTSGGAYVYGHNVVTDQEKIRPLVGYCPQFDALLDLLTVQEHLELYADIKGINKNEIAQCVDQKIEELNLEGFRHARSDQLSGGNKRKLSVAMATIGDPSVIFLDEPSSGMDAIARRKMWRIINRMTERGLCSVILTTHSMEEAEALCGRIGIMVNGDLQCLGSAQHLKHRFGQGLEVDLKLAGPTPEAIELVAQRLRDLGLVNHVRQPLDRQTVTDVTSLCIALSGNDVFLREARIRSLGESECAVFLDEALVAHDGALPLKLFCEWWENEASHDRLTLFMRRTFPGCEMIERSTMVACRYRVPQESPSLGPVFGALEKAKAELGLDEYAVGQATLEMIFNRFASRQSNPEV